MNTVLKSNSKEVTIGVGRPFVMIGEKINPTGRKKLAAALTEGNLDYVRQLALDQAAWGADVLDVNVGAPGIDEVAVVKQVVELVASVTDLPLCLDSANPDVLAAGLAAAPGKPLVNSVSGETKRLETVLPLVKERGAAVIGLTMDDRGIPPTAEERVAVAEKILNRAAQMGIPAEDVVIDPLVLTVGSDSKAALVTLQTIEILRKSLGVNVNVGASNVSFKIRASPAPRLSAGRGDRVRGVLITGRRPSVSLSESNYSALPQNRLGCHCEERSLRRSNPQAVKLA